ncbi:hypothetical protein FA13DRAFT_1342353 [Coprinellus micaceus]|uniref:Uncharacterized protein n=1 Tax=Coprinellus micaceus TaxID=71717 RepID=A0A4Y7TN99_COPMI|nr:hypothetical protein FA13DRAFT_1342353 [Coprinellus micaceus]
MLGHLFCPMKIAGISSSRLSCPKRFFGLLELLIFPSPISGVDEPRKPATHDTRTRSRNTGKDGEVCTTDAEIPATAFARGSFVRQNWSERSLEITIFIGKRSSHPNSYPVLPLPMLDGVLPSPMAIATPQRRRSA